MFRIAPLLVDEPLDERVWQAFVDHEFIVKRVPQINDRVMFDGLRKIGYSVTFIVTDVVWALDPGQAGFDAQISLKLA
jgi:hypothetical protein